MKPVYFSLGLLFFLAGLVGVVLPVLPTTPFMLLALWAFARSSERFHQWLYHHPLFGPPLQDWQRYRVIPLYAKVLSLGFMSASLLYLVLASTVPAWLTGLVALFMFAVAVYILGKPSYPPREYR